MLLDARRGALLSALVSLSSLLTSTSAQMSSSDTACTKHYTVQAGDTCDIIGQKTLTSTYQIMSLNLPQAGSDCYTLQIGVQLCLGTYGNDCQLVHRVSDSDTCGSIESQYSVSRDVLLSNNPMLSCDGIYNGMVLCVTQGIVRPPADPSLNVSYNALSPGVVNAVMPMGVALTAVNAALLEPAIVEVVTAQGASTATTSTSAAAASTSTAAANHKAYVKNHHTSHHKARDSGHKEAAKRYQMEHDGDRLAAQVS